MATSRRGKISEVFDEQAINDQIKRVVSGISEFVDVINKVKPSLSLVQNDAAKTKDVIDSMKQVSQATQQVSETSKTAVNEIGKLVEMGRKQAQGNTELANSYEQLIKASTQNAIASKELLNVRREIESSYKNGKISLEEYTNQLGEVKKKQNEISVSNLELNRSLRNIEKGFQSVGGSTNAMRAELNLSLQAMDRLSDEEKKSDVGVTLKKRIDELTKSITEQEEATGRFQRNVGNYNSSAKTIVDALSTVEQKIEALREKQQGLQNFSKADPIGFKLGNQASELNQVNALLATTEKEAEALKTITSDPKFFNLANVGSAKTEIRGFTTTLIELEQKGLGRTDFANDLRKHLAELTDQVADTREEIKAMSSDSRAFDQLSSSVNFLTHSYQTFVGIQALSGDQSEEAQETIKKLVAVQAVANGLQEVSEQLNKRGTIVNTAYVAVQKLWTTATDSSAVSTVRLAAATKLLLGGLLIGGLVLLVLKLKEWADAAGQISIKQRTLNEVSRAAADNYGKEKSQLDLLVATIKTEGATRAEKFAALKKLQDSYPGYFDNLKTEKDLNDKLADAYKRASEGILQKANAEAAANLLSQNASKKLTAQIDLQERIQKINQYEREGLDKEFAARGTKGVEQFREINQKARVFAAQEFNNLIKDISVQNDVLINSIQDANKEIEKLGGKTTKTETPTAAKAKAVDNSQIEKDLKARFELYKQEKQREIQLQKVIVDDVAAPFEARYNALIDSLSKEESLIKDQRAFDLKGEKLTEEERKLIISKSEDQLLEIHKQAGVKLVQIQTDSQQAQKKIFEDLRTFRQSEAQKQIDDITGVFSRQVTSLQQAADLQTDIELGRYKTGQINKEQFENKKLEIENEVRRKSLLFEIDYYEKLLKISNIAPDKQAEAEKKLADLRRQLRKEDVAENEDAIEKKKLKEQQYQDLVKSRLKELREELKATVFSLLESEIDRQKNEIQNRIQLLDEQKSKEIEVANQTILNEQDKAAKIAVINARAQAQKEALERRQRQLDEQKARFEKAKAVVDIIQSTTVAIVKTLAEYPGPQGIVLAAIIGAIGAAQLVRTLAQPIPHYAEGTDDHPGGLAVVGDAKKKEYVETPDGKVYETPATDTIVDIPKGSKVYKDCVTMDRMMNYHLTASLSTKERPNDYYQFQNIATSIEKMERSVVKAVKNIPTPVFDRSGLKQVIHGNGKVDEYIRGL
jgi:chromosome segregation ATPase